MSTQFLQEKTTQPASIVNVGGGSSSESVTSFCKVTAKSSNLLATDNSSNDSYETTWLMPTTFLSTIPTTDPQEKEAIKQLLHKFNDEHALQHLITQRACRQKSNLELNIGKDEGRFCDQEFDKFTITVYYYNHDQSWFVVGVKIVNKDPQNAKIEAIDLIECRSAIPTPSYSECGGSVTSPTRGGNVRQFETEYEYSIHMVIANSLYQLIVSGLGLIHFEKISSLEEQQQAN